MRHNLLKEEGLSNIEYNIISIYHATKKITDLKYDSIYHRYINNDYNDRFLLTAYGKVQAGPSLETSNLQATLNYLLKVLYCCINRPVILRFCLTQYIQLKGRFRHWI